MESQKEAQSCGEGGLPQSNMLQLGFLQWAAQNLPVAGSHWSLAIIVVLFSYSRSSISSSRMVTQDGSVFDNAAILAPSSSVSPSSPAH